jgi:hypothetical protein
MVTDRHVTFMQIHTCMHVCRYVHVHTCIRGRQQKPALAPRPLKIYCASPIFINSLLILHLEWTDTYLVPHVYADTYKSIKLLLTSRHQNHHNTGYINRTQHKPSGGVYSNLYSGGWSPTGSTRYCGHQWPNVPAPVDCDDGESGGVIDRWNRSTRRKPAPVPLCPPQTPHAARTRTRSAKVGSQSLTAWATARPISGS